MSSWPGRPRRKPAADANEAGRQALRRRRRRRRVRRTVAWTVLLVVGVSVGLGVRLGGDATVAWVRENTDLLDVRSVDVGGTVTVPPWEVVDYSGVVPGDDLLDLEPEAVAVRLADHPRLVGAAAKRTFRGTVKLEVEERRPHALLLDGEVYELDPTGVMLGPPPEFPVTWVKDAASARPRGLELPLITGVDLAGRGPGVRIDDPGVRHALAFLSRLDAYGYHGREWVSEIRIEGDESLVVYMLDGGLPVQIGDGRISRSKMRAFFAALAEIRADEVPVRYVDLRFQDMVIVKKGRATS